MIEIKKLAAGYGALQVLYDVDLKVDPDEIVVIIGPNGAGKSTVLKSIFNMTDIKSGKIIYKNKDITALPTHERIQLGIGYVPQGRQVFSTLTVEENLKMGAYLTKGKDLIKKRMEEVMQHFPILKEKFYDRADTLSGGQQQMLAIGRSLMQDPQILLLDEPSLGLSPKAMKEVFQKIIEIKEEGCSILMVEQNAKQAMQIADRTYVLEDGKVVLHGDKRILKDKRIKSIYLGGR